MSVSWLCCAFCTHTLELLHLALTCSLALFFFVLCFLSSSSPVSSFSLRFPLLLPLPLRDTSQESPVVLADRIFLSIHLPRVSVVQFTQPLRLCGTATRLSTCSRSQKRTVRRRTTLPMRPSSSLNPSPSPRTMARKPLVKLGESALVLPTNTLGACRC